MGLIGIVLAGASSFFDGSWACPFKLVKSPPHAVLWQLAVCFGVLVTSIIVGVVLQVGEQHTRWCSVLGPTCTIGTTNLIAAAHSTPLHYRSLSTSRCCSTWSGHGVAAL